MNRRRWNSLKVGDLLAGRTGKQFVIVGVKRTTPSVLSDAKPRVLEIRLARFLEAQDPDQWRVCTKGEAADAT